MSANRFGAVLGLGVMLVGFAVRDARASIIDIDSNTAGLGEYNFAPLGNGNDVAIAVSPNWTPAGSGYEWVSYANTGCNTFVVLTGACTAGPDNPMAVAGDVTLDGNTAPPTAVFFNQFNLDDGTYSGSLSVWASGAARIFLNGNLLMDASPVMANNCAGAPIGCVSNMAASFTLTPDELFSGSNLLEIDAYQLDGGSPFGIMYSGFVSDSVQAQVPEPTTYVLMGLGLIGIGVLVPRARRS